MRHNLLQDLVTVIVTFNRALYAQLAQQQFQPPQGYPLPPLNSPTFRASELGMKLTCGFEMVMAKSTSGAVPFLQTPFCLCIRLYITSFSCFLLNCLSCSDGCCQVQALNAVSTTSSYLESSQALMWGDDLATA